MKAQIRKQDTAAEFFTEEKCHIIEVSNSPDDSELSIARARVEVGVTTRWHLLIDTAERYVMMSGEGSVELAGQPPQDITAGDVVLIPSGCPQRITNTGSNDLIFMAVCTPPFKPERYVDLGTSFEIAPEFGNN